MKDKLAGLRRFAPFAPAVIEAFNLPRPAYSWESRLYIDEKDQLRKDAVP
jgi:hypothetical protein